MSEAQLQKVAALEKKVGSGGKSPLFAQLASYYLQQGKAKEALRLCDEGLSVFPHYTTAHLVKGKALLALKMNAEARHEFEIVQSFLPSNETVAFLLSSIQPGDGEILTASPAEQVGSRQADAATAPKSAPEISTNPSIEETPLPPESSAAPPLPSVPEAEMTPQEMQQETAPPANIEEVAADQQLVDDPFGLISGAGVETASPAEHVVEESALNSFDGFPSQLGPETAPTGQPTAEAAPSTDMFGLPPGDQQSAEIAPKEDSFETFAVRMRAELGGGENLMTLEEYLNPPSSDQGSTQPPSPAPPLETIENLTEKLQSAKKITPVINFTTKETIPASEADTPASTGFVTPTLAEIYAKQGWYDDAIKAYKTLCVTKPAERERFEQRIAELEELKKQQG